MLKLGNQVIKCSKLLVVVFVSVFILSHFSSHVKAATSTSTGSTLRDWLAYLKSEATILENTSYQLEKSIALLIKANSTNAPLRITHLAKVKKALAALYNEIEVINQACSTFSGPDCDLTSCNSGWSGVACNVPVCASKCLNCTSPGQCSVCSGNWIGSNCSTCKSGWNGTECNVPVCDVRCLNCSSPGQCTTCFGNWIGLNCSSCKNGWSGVSCDVPVCDSKCLNCTSPGQCFVCSGNWIGSNCSTCKSGWNGIECNVPVCDLKCLNCTSPGQCSLCSGNWIGSNCSTCKTGWSGTNCTIASSLDIGDMATSSILTSSMATRFMTDLISGVVRTSPVKLLFRSSRDGITCVNGAVSANFQTQVFDKGPTFIIIKATTGAIFGGYTSQSWTASSPKWVDDPAAFLFSIQSSTGAQRFTKLAQTTTGQSILTANSAVVRFGGGYDIKYGCPDNLSPTLYGMTNPKSYASMGQYYLTGSNVPYDTSGSYFDVSDFEMYSV